MAAPGSLRVAVVGCAHGELDGMYAAVAEAASAHPSAASAVDLILCAGDFEAVRNEDDLECMAVPDKYKDMGEFWKYYVGSSVANTPTVFIGGNHEASNHLQELPLGGLVAPNIYFLGPAGVLNFRGLRVGGISGIYMAHNFRRPSTEAPPYPGHTLKSVYHTREPIIAQLARLRRPLAVFLSHDWPAGIEDHGDKADLLRKKPFLEPQMDDGSLGSPASAHLLKTIRPRYWFAAHMHVKFAALVQHPPSNTAPPTSTRFLALDKTRPPRDFLQILDIAPAPGAAPFDPAGPEGDATEFVLDKEWLAILRSPGRGATLSDGECFEAGAAVERAGLSLSVRSPADFDRTARVYDPANRRRGVRPDSVSVQKGCVDLAQALGVGIAATIHAQSLPPVHAGVAQVAPEVVATGHPCNSSANWRTR